MGKYIIDIEEGKEGVILCQTGIVAVGLHLNDEDSLKPLGIKSAIPYIEPSRGKIYKNAYQKGIDDAWEVVKKIESLSGYKLDEIFTGYDDCVKIFENYTPQEAIDRIQKYEDEQRQYLDTFCKCHICSDCPLCTPEFTCGRGNHFCTNHPVSDEEVRRAYAKVLKNNEISE